MVDDRDSRRIDGLLASYGQLGRDMSALQERVAGAAREREGDLKRIEGLISDLRNELRSAVATWRDERAEDKRAALEARRYSRGERIALLGPTVAMVAIAIALLQGAHP